MRLIVLLLLILLVIWLLFSRLSCQPAGQSGGRESDSSAQNTSSDSDTQSSGQETQSQTQEKEGHPADANSTPESTDNTGAQPNGIDPGLVPEINQLQGLNWSNTRPTGSVTFESLPPPPAMLANKVYQQSDQNNAPDFMPGGYQTCLVRFKYGDRIEIERRYADGNVLIWRSKYRKLDETTCILADKPDPEIYRGLEIEGLTPPNKNVNVLQPIKIFLKDNTILIDAKYFKQKN